MQYLAFFLIPSYCRSVVEVSKFAGLNNKSATLLVDETYGNDIKCFIDICSIVKEGI